ncbi:type 4a pilus biogenesis protein PilO [Lacimicrobium sp. SS2-24]|uniref:type 4a pilus biogenesis protein PilO n=1 Tax=Lacimicrobium sp. SS2-24 TaxID=2005569 RepID=UPI000B4AA4A2|nr:type 4a pilus biogenesis protein PilO [Lacimicrobium sp. SS2-24]
MKFDFNKLKEMNDLDFEQVAIWPFEVKFVVGLVIAILTGVLGFYLLVNDKLPALETAEAKEVELKNSYEVKYRVAINLQAYEEQLAKIQQDFSSMLRSLPTSNETPGLLDDITFVGTSAGLNFKLLNWQKEVPKEFYTELPIQMEVRGDYHDFGKFLSDVAGLPRIVTVHDFEMVNDGGGLRLSLQAQTYRTSTTSGVAERAE